MKSRTSSARSRSARSSRSVDGVPTMPASALYRDARVLGDDHVLEHGEARTSPTCWKVRPSPSWARCVGAEVGDVFAVHERRGRVSGL